MRVDRRAFLLVLALAAACSRVETTTPVGRAAAYLWSQQTEAGSFPSTTYGLLRSGHSLTPFVLDVLLDVPAEEFDPPRGGVDRALEFIRTETSREGILGRTDGSTLDYPNYATAMGVMVLAKARREGWREDIAPMVSALRRQQFSEDNGWMPDDAPYGGWGMGGPIHTPPNAGHVDLSMTRYVMEALRVAGTPASDPAFARALVYLERSQNPDGGFFFSPVNTETNKAGRTDDGFASYGTATADGVLALRAAGLDDSDTRIVRGLAWLREHHQPDRAPGFDHTAREAWGAGLRFYYAGVVSRAAPDLPLALPPQDAGGSFSNPNTMVKEDDPLIATTLALRALLSRR
jgi:hypothetical protein